jgi:hypothetical protein
MRALSRPVAPRWQPPIRCGAPDRRISAWVVSWPAATEPSLAVKSIVVVKVALPFVSF